MREFLDSITAILKVVLESKWKVGATILLLTLGLSGSLVWSERDVLIGIWAKKPAVVQVDKFARLAPTIMEQLDATGAILLVVELEKNERTVVYFATRAKGRITTFDGFKSQPFPRNGTDSYALQTARLMAKDAFCEVEGKPVTAFGEARYKEKLIAMCRAPIMDGDRLIGVVSLGFETLPKNPPSVLDQLSVLAQSLKD